MRKAPTRKPEKVRYHLIANKNTLRKLDQMAKAEQRSKSVIMERLICDKYAKFITQE